MISNEKTKARSYVEPAVQSQHPTICPLAEKLGQPGAYQALRSSVKEMLQETFFGRQRGHVEDHFIAFSKNYGLTELLRDYKKAKRDKNGEYDIEKLVSDSLAKKAPKKKSTGKDDMEKAEPMKRP
ncbi:MAG: hypothetical protein IKI21_12615 [Oscillospiraceae bacterium]|nr:hypothetical protein [Oscillospiraceae bacterium]